MSGVSHMPLALNVSPIVAAVCRMVEVQKPVGDVDLVDHQVGEDAAAEIPEPAPVAEAVLVERLLAAPCPGTASSRPFAGSMLYLSRAQRGVLRFQVRWTLWMLPSWPDLTISYAFWNCGMLRCCVPTCTIRW